MTDTDFQFGLAPDDLALQRKTPYPLIPTNLKGVYTNPAPPDSFDPVRAPAADLVKYGLLWPRPAATDEPALVDVWNAVFSARWREKDRIVPALRPQSGKTHQIRRKRRTTDGGFTSDAWAGGVFTGGLWSSVTAAWTVPTVGRLLGPQGAEGWSSTCWLGLDGFKTGRRSSCDVLQAGIEQSIDDDGEPTYTVWFAWHAPARPGAPAYIHQTNVVNFPLDPGDTIQCYVSYANANTSGYVFVANLTRRKFTALTLAPPPGATFRGDSISWIVEAPDDRDLADLPATLPPVKFTAAAASGPTGVVGNPRHADTVDIVSAHGQLLTRTTPGHFGITINGISRLDHPRSEKRLGDHQLVAHERDRSWLGS
jgi:hypothetical protein